ncbi:MAG: rhomboid family intramembrane serine protease [Coleofasciculus sp. Co-bin14]|nr:rhomboid family intramembrane serine protease [Coleofasciculus sp. Co-bin14]
MAITSGLRSESKAEEFRLLCELVMYILCLGTVNLVFCGGAFNRLGIRPRTSMGLLGILFTPFLHLDWSHLLGNLMLFFILGWFIMLGGMSHFYIVTAFTVIVGGLGVWIFGRPASHCGASGVIFGYIGFLLLSGYFLRDSLSIVLSTLVGLCYGRLLWGVFPRDEGTSWEGHLFGFLGGVLAAGYLDVLKAMFPLS